MRFSPSCVSLLFLTVPFFSPSNNAKDGGILASVAMRACCLNHHTHLPPRLRQEVRSLSSSRTCFQDSYTVSPTKTVRSSLTILSPIRGLIGDSAKDFSSEKRRFAPSDGTSHSAPFAAWRQKHGMPWGQVPPQTRSRESKRW